MDNLTLHRAILTGGDAVLSTYLNQFSLQETPAEFYLRLNTSYAPGKVKSCVQKVALAILDRLGEVTRLGGDKTYIRATNGFDTGVDGQGRSMQAYLSNHLLELLIIGKMAFVVDKAPGDPLTLADVASPYIYAYSAEEILSYARQKSGALSAIKFACIEQLYDEHGLPESALAYTLTYSLIDGATHIYDSRTEAPTILALSVLPIVLYDQPSLVTDAARHEVALLNLASADLHYALKSNFPFYTQQTDGSNRGGGLRREASTVTDADGNVIPIAASNDITAGPTKGVQYPKGVDRPGFIAPPTEPLLASMKKQEAISDSIEDLIYLAVATQSTSIDAGLAKIGLQLQHLEQQLANIWAMYQGSAVAIINYPDKYTLRTQEDRLKESSELLSQLPKFPTTTGQRELAIKAISLLLIDSGKDVRDAIVAEISSALIVSNDPDQLRADHEAGLLSTSTACDARLYPPGEADKAKADHAERLERIVIAQTAGYAKNIDNKNLSTPEERKNLKRVSQGADLNPESQKRQTRGPNK